MRISRGALFGVIVLTIASFILVGFGRSPLSSPSDSALTSADVSSHSSVSRRSLQIDSDRLLQDVEHLSFVRHSDAARREARDYIMHQLQQAGWHPEEHPFTAQQAGESVRGVNVLAIKPGDDPSASTMLLGAHYDTVADSPGADDNASGVAVVLELARSLIDVPTSHAVAIALFDLEEVGLLGSTALAEDLGRSLTLGGAIILEMMGYTCNTAGCQRYPQALPISPPSDTGDFLAVVGDLGHSFLTDAFQGADQSSAESASAMPPTVTLQVPTLGPMMPDLLRSDHVPFWRKGIGAVMVTDTANFRNPHYHQPSDRPETLDAEFLTRSAALTLEAIARLAQ